VSKLEAWIVLLSLLVTAWFLGSAHGYRQANKKIRRMLRHDPR